MLDGDVTQNILAYTLHKWHKSIRARIRAQFRIVCIWIIIFGIKCNIILLNLTQHLLVACRAERMPRIVQMSPSSSDPDSVAVAAESHETRPAISLPSSALTGEIKT